MAQRGKRPDSTVSGYCHGPIVQVSIDKLDHFVKLLSWSFYLLLSILYSGTMQPKPILLLLLFFYIIGLYIFKKYIFIL